MAFQALAKWPLGRRLLAISLMSLLPIAYLLFGLVSEKRAALSYASAELSGLRDLEPMRAAAMGENPPPQAAETIAKQAFDSHLTLDPEPDSHYLASATLLRLPGIVQRVTSLSAFALDIVEHGMGNDDRSEMTLQNSALAELANEFK